jgi:pyruvate, water dikinase
MPDDLYWFNQIQPAQRSLVGDKAFYLALLEQRGCPVVPGVVVSSSRFRDFLQQIDWRSPLLSDLPYSSLHLDVNQPRQLQAIAQQLRSVVQEAIVPEEWLVRLEAAIQVWATQAIVLRPSFSLPPGTDLTVSHRTTGLLQAQVCGTRRSDLVRALKQVWSELFRAKSLLYWQRLGVQLQQINLAVLMQPLWGAIASGTMQGQDNSLDIQATYGLGIALTQGEALPDHYHITAEHIQQQLGQKAYAYRVASPPSAASQPAASQPAHLERYVPALPQQAALSEAQLHQLAALNQQAIATLDTALALEWTLCQHPDRPPTFYLTQATPQLTGSRLSIPLDRLPHAERRSTEQQSIKRSSEKHGFASPFTGISASPGVVSAPAWLVSAGPVPPGVILVAARITPELLVGLESIVGILTEQGGTTSHGAILARELGIPAVVGVPNITRLIRTGDSLLLDGDRGWVQVGQQHKLLARSVVSDSEARSSKTRSSEAKSTGAKAGKLAGKSGTQLFVALSQTSSAQAAAKLPVAGLGLLRSELMVLEQLEGRSPHQWIQDDRQPELIERLTAQITTFAATFAPRPVFYRSLDWRSHELSAPGQIPEQIQEEMRGTFGYQLDPAAFEAELTALRQVQQQGYDKLRLILPFVRTVEEFDFCRQRVIKAGLTQVEGFQLWIMAEVPSVLLLLPEYVSAGVQGIAIGTNDLTQLLLGVDRDHPQLATAFTPEHPTVLKAIQQLIQTAKHLNIPCHLCGRSTVSMVKALLEWEIDGIVVEPSQVAEMGEAIVLADA